MSDVCASDVCVTHESVVCVCVRLDLLVLWFVGSCRCCLTALECSRPSALKKIGTKPAMRHRDNNI